MAKQDRRVQRTRDQLQKALIALIREQGYDAVTIQDIADRANIGRTTFYLHYNSKDELFISCHEAIVGEFDFGPRHPQTREQLLAPDPPPGMVAAYRHLYESRALLYPIFQGNDSLAILRRILRNASAGETEAALRAAFPEAEPAMPFEMLASYLAGAHLSLLQWWLEKHRAYTPEEIAQTFHRLQRAAIRDAIGLI